MNIGETFDQVSNIMRAKLNLARASIDIHGGLKGTAFENVVAQFLKEHLPYSIDVSSGFVIDCDGNQSKQLDIVLCDAAKTPKFFQSEGLRVVPVECVYGIIEVKADLQPSDLTDIVGNMNSLRRLEKKSYVRSTDNPKNIIHRAHEIYGKLWDIWPIHYFVFAFDSASLETLVSTLDQDVRNRNATPWTRIDSVCVLDKGVVCNRHPDGGIDALPGPGSVYQAVPTARALLLFYSLICTHLFQAELPSLRLNPYIEKIIL